MEYMMYDVTDVYLNGGDTVDVLCGLMGQEVWTGI